MREQRHEAAGRNEAMVEDGPSVAHGQDLARPRSAAGARSLPGEAAPAAARTEPPRPTQASSVERPDRHAQVVRLPRPSCRRSSITLSAMAQAKAAMQTRVNTVGGDVERNGGPARRQRVPEQLDRDVVAAIAGDGDPPEDQDAQEVAAEVVGCRGSTRKTRSAGSPRRR